MNNCIYCQLSLSYASSLFNKGFPLPNNIKKLSHQSANLHNIHLTCHNTLPQPTRKELTLLLPVTFSGPNLKYEY